MVSKSRFDEEIANIVEQLVRLYKPDKVILFGSLAEGQIHPDSDIDLFIIKSDVPETGVDRIRQLDGLIKYRLATDFIVYRPDELDRRLQMGDPFVKNILHKGKVLYEAA
jgi:predicted nucleotidyltransferase